MDLKKLILLIFCLFSHELLAVDLIIEPAEMTAKINPSSLSGNRQLLMEQAQGFRARGDDANLLIILNKLITNYPKYVEPFHIKGKLLLKTGNLKATESVFRQLLKSYPNDKVGLEMLGQVRFQRGDKEEAQKLLLLAEQQGGGLTRETNKMLAKIYEKKGQCDKALTYIGRSTGMHQSNQSQLDQAMMIKRCMGDSAKYLHGNINLNIEKTNNQSRRFNRQY